MGCWVWGAGYGVPGMGCWVWGIGYGVLGMGCWVWGAGYGVLGMGCWVWGAGYGVLGSGVLPLMTSPFPIRNLNGLPLSREESNFFPFVSVPVCVRREEGSEGGGREEGGRREGEGRGREEGRGRGREERKGEEEKGGMAIKYTSKQVRQLEGGEGSEEGKRVEGG